jgi:hypothetical protein
MSVYVKFGYYCWFELLSFICRIWGFCHSVHFNSSRTRRAKGIWLSADHLSLKNRTKIVWMDLDLAWIFVRWREANWSFWYAELNIG